MLNSFNLRKKNSSETMLVSEYFNGNAKMVRKTKVKIVRNTKIGNSSR